MPYNPIATEIGAIYTLTGPDGSVAVFNDPASPNYVGALTELSGLDSAEVRESQQELVEADGGAHGDFYLGRRPIVLTGKVFGHVDIAERNRRLDRARRASLGLRGDSVLKWIPNRPTALRTNWFPNPSAEIDVSLVKPHAGGSQPITRQNVAVYGTYSFQVTGDGSVTNQGIESFRSPTDQATPPIPAASGETWTASAWVRTSSTPGTNAEIVIREATSSGGLGTSTVGSAVSLSSAWQRVSVTRTLTDAATTQIVIFIRLKTATAQTWQIDGILVEKTATLQDFIDPNAEGTTFLGAAHASASRNYTEVFTNVRRQQPFRESGAWVKDFQVPLVSESALIQSSNEIVIPTGANAYNEGNYPAYPIVEITGTAVDPTVTSNGITFRTTGLTLDSGEKVEFDMLRHTGKFTAGARNGQSANKHINFSTTGWPYLVPFAVVQTFTTAGGGTVNIRYRHQWA